MWDAGCAGSLLFQSSFREIQAADRGRMVEFPEIVREGQAVAICRRRDASGTLPALPVSGARTGPLRGGWQLGDRKERSHVRRE
jgi:hypothetical protein